MLEQNTQVGFGVTQITPADENIPQEFRDFFRDKQPCVRSKFLGGEGVVDGEGGSSEGCLKWGGGGGVSVIKGSFQKRLKTGGG